MKTSTLQDKVHGILTAHNKGSAPSRKELTVLMDDPAEKLDQKLLRDGNTKLGNKILVWGIPAVASCPGRTKLCESLCYATKNFYTFKESVHSRHVNFALANRPDFAELIIADLAKSKRKIVRVHDSGDMFSSQYTFKWLHVMTACPDKKFFLFTRSWRVPDSEPILRDMAKLDNVRLWYSIDKETGFPSKIPPRVRLAYMQVGDTDVPARQVDLVFRDTKVRGSKVKKVGGAIVCPYENGITKVGTENVDKAKQNKFSCSTCGICWDSLDGPKDSRKHHGQPVKGTGRKSLPVLAPTL